MKLRNGFVSNSSSSSFVAIMRREDVDAMKKNMCALERVLVDFSMNCESVLGVDCMVFSDFSGHGGEGSYDYISENSEDILTKAKELALKENIPLLVEKDLKEVEKYDDDEEKDCAIRDCVGGYYYGVREGIDELEKQGKAWTKRMDW
jgi:hypothetical protein